MCRVCLLEATFSDPPCHQAPAGWLAGWMAGWLAVVPKRFFVILSPWTLINFTYCELLLFFCTKNCLLRFIVHFCPLHRFLEPIDVVVGPPCWLACVPRSLDRFPFRASAWPLRAFLALLSCGAGGGSPLLCLGTGFPIGSGRPTSTLATIVFSKRK